MPGPGEGTLVCLGHWRSCSFLGLEFVQGLSVWVSHFYSYFWILEILADFSGPQFWEKPEKIEKNVIYKLNLNQASLTEIKMLKDLNT